MYGCYFKVLQLNNKIYYKFFERPSHVARMSPPSTRAIRRLLQRDKYALCQFVSPQEAHKGRSCDCLTR